MISNEVREAAIADYIEGKLKVEEITQKYGISRSILSYWTTKAKLPVRRTFISPEVKSAAIADYLAGELSVKKIAQKYGISSSAITGWISEEQLRKAPVSEEIKRGVIADYLAGELSNKEIAQKYNIHRNTINTWIPTEQKRVRGNGTRVSRYSQNIKDAVIAECEAGELTVKEIAEKYNMNYNTVYNWYNAYVEKEELKMEAAKADYLAGVLKVKEICEKYGISEYELLKLIPKDQRRGRWNCTPQLRKGKKEAIIADYNANELTLKEIAIKHGLSIESVMRYVPNDQKDENRRSKSPYSQATKDAIAEDYLRGLSIKEICKKYNMGRSTVYSHLPDGAINRRGRSEQIRDSVIADYLAGELTIKKIAEKYGVCTVTIVKLTSSISCRSKTTRKTIKRLTQDIKDSAIADYLAGELSIIEISEKYNIHYNTIYRWIPKEQRRCGKKFPSK